MVFIRIFQFWSVNDGVSRTHKAEQEGEGGTDAYRSRKGRPEGICLQLSHVSSCIKLLGAAPTEA